MAPVVDGALAVVDEPPDPWPPIVTRRYKRLEKLGEGMFSEVYKAWDRKLRRTVAVKHLRGRTDYRFVKTDLHEFAREAMSLRACRGHPGVVKLLATFADSSRSDGDCFLVMEYTGRMNLRDYAFHRRACSLERPFGEAETRGVMAQLLRGVQCAHAAGVLHRDVEPESVLVKERRGVMKRGPAVAYKLCGFGMSEPAARTGTEKDGMARLAASRAYRAPELFLGSTDYDGRVDTWGLGCIMAELLAGTSEGLFGGQPENEQLQYILETVGARGIKEWPGLQRVAEIDPETEKMVRRCPDTGRLRELIPEELLSDAGFDVLSGLLESRPGERLTAEAALEMPWFKRRRGFGGCFA